jgi:DNA-binding response OmpR family regulator
MQERILVVDDDPDILQFVRVNLEVEGYEAETAGNHREPAVEYFSARKVCSASEPCAPKMA